MLAEYLRSCARWRLDRADEADGGGNARSTLGLLDAVAYTQNMDDTDRVVVRMGIAGCFALGRFNPGIEGEWIIRCWHYENSEGGPADLFDAIATAAERGLVPAQRTPAFP
jgi:hypothetical protein